MQRCEPGGIMTHPAEFSWQGLQTLVQSGPRPPRLRPHPRPDHPQMPGSMPARHGRPCADANWCAEPRPALPHVCLDCLKQAACAAGSVCCSCHWSCRTQLVTSRRTWREADHVLYARLRVATKATRRRHSSGVERVIGNDEVHSSNLCGGTIFPDLIFDTC